MGAIYTHVTKGTRPSTYAAAAVVALVFVMSLTIGAPWWIWTSWLPLGFAVVYFQWRKPVGLFKLESDRLTVSAQGFKETWDLEDIETVELISWDDEPDTCRLDFGHGQTVLLPEAATPPADEAMGPLQALGVHVKRR